MPQCTLCAHPERRQIERAILARQETQTAIAARYGLTVRMLQNHAHRHLGPAATAAARHRGPRPGDVLAVGAVIDNIRAEVATLYAAQRRIADAAEADGNFRTALHGLKEARESLALLARMEGELNDGATVNVALVQSPEWNAVRGELLRALDTHPEARVAVVRRLLTLEGGRDVGTGD
jgi:hypothetical protein